MEDEIWKVIPSFPTYDVSNKGNVRSRKKDPPIILKPSISPKGYKQVGLFEEGESYGCGVHRLVCEAFNGPPRYYGYQACHNDGDPTNNHPDNLRWDSVKNNHADKIEHGTIDKDYPTDLKILAIRMLVDKKRIPEIVETLGLSKQIVYAAKHKRAWEWVKPNMLTTEEVENNITQESIDLLYKDKEIYISDGVNLGELNHFAKLDRDTVIQIRRRIKKGKSNKQILLEFAPLLTYDNFKLIRRGETWKDVSADDLCSYEL